MERHFAKKKTFFNASEKKYYEELRKKVDLEKYVLLSKVRLLDIFDVEHDSEWWTSFAKIRSKHVDFLICKRDTYEPVGAIEVDGSSHKNPDRIKRDEFVNSVFEQAGLPLVHINDY